MGKEIYHALQDPDYQKPFFDVDEIRTRTAPDGNETAESEETRDTVITALIRPEELERCREEIPYWQDLDPEILSEAARAAEGARHR